MNMNLSLAYSEHAPRMPTKQREHHVLDQSHHGTRA